MNPVRSNILSLKYQMFPTSGFNDIRVLIFEFVAKTQFLSISRALLVCSISPGIANEKKMHEKKEKI